MRQMAVMTRVVVPEMEKDGYDRGYAASLTAAAGLLGPIIPPSMIFIIFGVIAQVSNADMFTAGIVPGFVLFTFILVLALFQASLLAARAGGQTRLVSPSNEASPAPWLPVADMADVGDRDHALFGRHGALGLRSCLRPTGCREQAS